MAEDRADGSQVASPRDFYIAVLDLGLIVMKLTNAVEQLHLHADFGGDKEGADWTKTRIAECQRSVEEVMNGILARKLPE